MWTRLLAAAAFCLIVPSIGSADDFVLTPLSKQNKSAKPFVVGGVRADPAQFTSTLIFETDQRCTATIVGQRSVLTAAHCVANNLNGSLKLNGRSIPLTCEMHSHYAGAACLSGNPVRNECTADIALCLAGSVISAPGMRYEKVHSTVEAPLRVGSSIVLLGYGCTSHGGAPSNALYLGSANIRSISKGDAATTPEESFHVVQGGAVACEGDSGAGALNAVNLSARRLIGVTSNTNEAMNITRLVSPRDRRIYLYMVRWGNSRNTKICGVHGNAPGCPE